MKKIIYTCLGLFAFCALLSSCDKFLDRQEDEKLTFDKIWENRGKIKQYWLNAMSFLPRYGGAGLGDAEPYLGASDECTITYNRAFRAINFGSWNPSNIPYYKFAQYYNGIRECNIFLQNADRASDPLLTEDQLEEWKLQTRFARAYYYFLLMRDYGPVFLLGDELLDFSASTQELMRPRNTWEQCVEYVCSEMKACAEDPAMPLQSSLDDSKYGLATKGTCYAVISRLRLYSARPLFNGNKLYRNLVNPTIDKDTLGLSGVHLFPQEFNAQKWVEAAEAAHKVFDLNEYRLYVEGDGSNPYANYSGVMQKPWNSELIWTDKYHSLYSYGVTTVPTGVGGTAYGGVGPTQQQVDAYAMSNGRYPITGQDQDGSPKIDETSGYPADEFKMVNFLYPSSGWSKHNDFQIQLPAMYANREPRFYITVFTSQMFWLHNNAKTLISFAKGANSNKSHDYPKSGYLCNRFYNHLLNSANGNWGNFTFPVFRLGGIYLNFIESVLEARRHGAQLPAGYEEEAFQKWDELRARSGMPPILKAYPEAAGQYDMLVDLCLKERRVELAFERHRYFDTRTRMIAEQTDGGPMWGMNVNTPGSTNVTPKSFWKRTVFETRVFNKNHYLHPFSQRELDRNKLLVQNYGW